LQSDYHIQEFYENPATRQNKPRQILTNAARNKTNKELTVGDVSIRNV